MFGPSIEYGAMVNRLCFDSEQVNQPLTTANPELARINDQAVMDYLARFDHESIAMQVRSKIIEHLPGGVPRQGDIAAALQMSLRSLQRRLKEEETSFKDLLEDTKRRVSRTCWKIHAKHWRRSTCANPTAALARLPTC
jgi:AraC-like DNA-binding protein